ncbi:MAG: AsmA family protein [Beijerinckiaceae bacterium]|nr:AsmA family protein [Beijerinckiaceae bacterium]
MNRMFRALLSMRRVFGAVLGLALLLLAVAAILPPMIDWSSYRTEFEGKLSSLIGRPVKVRGPVHVSLLPVPSIDLAKVQIDDETQPISIAADRLTFQLKLSTLLFGEIDITSSLLEHPVVTLQEVAAPKIIAAPKAAADGLKQEAQRGLPGSARLVIVDGEVRRATTAALIAGFAFDLDYSSRKASASGHGTVTIEKRQLKVRYALDDIKASDAHLGLQIEDEQASASLVLDGRTSVAPGRPSFEGTADAIGAVALWTADVPRSLSWRGKSRATLVDNMARFETIELTLGTAPQQDVLTGDGTLTFTDHLDVQAAFRSPKLDLDTLIGVGNPPVILPFDAFTEVREFFTNKDATPNKLSFHIDLGVQSIKTGGDAIQNFGFVASGRDDAWTIETARADMPGNATLAMKGTPLQTLSVANILSGRFMVEVGDQKRFFGWFDGQLPQTGGDQPPPTAVRLDADAIFEPKGLWLPKLRIAYGGSIFQGDGRYSFPLAKVSVAASSVRRIKPDLGRIGVKLTSPMVDFGVFPLAAFQDTPFVSPNLDLDLKVTSARYKSASLDGLSLLFHRDDDKRVIEKLVVDDFSGVRLEGSGSIERLEKKGRLRLKAGDLEAFSATLKSLFPGPLPDVLAMRAKYLAPADVEVSLALADNRDEPVVKFGIDGQLDKTRLGGSGVWQIGPSDRKNVIDLTFNAGDEVKLLRQLGFTGVLGNGVEAGKLDLSAKGNIAKGYEISALAEAATAKMTIDGKLLFTSPAAPFDGKLVLEVPDVRRFGQIIGANAELLARNGSASIKGRLIAGLEKITLTEFTALFRREAQQVAKVGGEIAVHFEDKLRVAGSIKTDYVNGRWLASVPLGVSPPATERAGDELWAVTPFAAPEAPSLSGDLWVETERVALGPDFSIDDARFVLRFKPEQLSFEHGDVRFGGGRIGGELRLDRTGQSANVEMRLQLTDVETQRLTSLPITTRLNGAITVKGSGGSPAELVRSLDGSGTIALREIRFDTVDPRPVADMASMLPFGERKASQPIAQDKPDGTTDMRTLSAQLDGAMKPGSVIAQSGSMPVAVSGGSLKFGPLIVETKTGLLRSEATFDLSSARLDATTRIMPLTPATDERAPGPQAVVTWSGGLKSLRRSVDLTSEPTEMNDGQGKLPTILPASSLPVRP